MLLLRLQQVVFLAPEGFTRVLMRVCVTVEQGCSYYIFNRSVRIKVSRSVRSKAYHFVSGKLILGG